MKAVLLKQAGGLENLVLVEREPKAPGGDEVQVRVHYCGVCYRDIIDRKGGFPFMRLPIVPGHEFAGEVVAVGEKVRRLRTGMRVANLHHNVCGECRFCREGETVNCASAYAHFGLTVDGGYAEYCTAPESCFVPVEEGVPLQQAALLLCTAGTAYRAFQRVGLQAGERVLVTGASGGVGAVALQVAKILGAMPVAVTSSEAKREKLAGLGVEVLVSPQLDYQKRFRAEGGVDVVLEIVGSATMEASLKSLRTDGRMALIGNVRGERYALNPGLLILKELRIVGSHTATEADLRTLFGWVKEGKLNPQVEAVLPLSEAQQAQQMLEAKRAFGRVVLQVGS